MTDLSIITVTHESSSVIGDWLSGLGSVTDAVEVIVVDSGSSDYNQLRVAIGDYPLRLARQALNVGYGAGNNVGARLASGAWLAFVNPDVNVAAADLLVAARRAEELNISCVGTKLIEPNGNVRKQALDLPRPPWSPRSLIADAVTARGEIRWARTVSGCVMIMNARVFEDIGGFDEAFFLFMEEFDLHQRLISAGHRIAVIESVTAVTIGGQSSAGVSKRWSSAERAASHVRYYRKHFGLIPALCDFVARMLTIAWDPQFRPRRLSFRQFLLARPLIVITGYRKRLLERASRTWDIEQGGVG